jgi:MoxR-like ATPase
MSDWRIFTGKQSTDTGTAPVKQFPAPPPWRVPGVARAAVLAATFQSTPEQVDAVNAAIYLRRPLLITGKPGSGKSSLIYSVAQELGLGSVLVWAVTSRSTLRDALYSYDALGRLQYIQERQAGEKPAATLTEAEKAARKAEETRSLGQFLKLGPLGTAVAAGSTRALLVDEIDKSDVDLPNDLLNILDTGHFKSPELQQRGGDQVSVTDEEGGTVEVKSGQVSFTEYPFVVMTSNGERDFPAPFLRRCVQFELPEPGPDELRRIVMAHFTWITKDSKDLEDLKDPQSPQGLLAKFIAKRNELPLSTDQLLNAVHVLRNPQGPAFSQAGEDQLLKTLFQKLG